MRKTIRRRLMPSTIRRWLMYKWPADAGDYIKHLATHHRHHPILMVVLYCRVSGRCQNRKGTLKRQERKARQVLKRYGIVVVACYGEVESGWRRDDRPRLMAAIARARELGVPLVAESVDRFIRSEHFNDETNQGALPTDLDFEDLVRLANGVTLLTLLHPDADPEAVHWYQQNRGQEGTGNKGGRPRKKQPGYKKQRRLKLLPRVREMRLAGASLGQIAKQTTLPRSTVQGWVASLA